MLKPPFVVWPAPASPAFLSTYSRQFSALVAFSSSDAASVRAWWHDPALQDHEGRRIPLRLLEVQAVDRSRGVPQQATEFLSLPAARELPLFQCVLEPATAASSTAAAADEAAMAAGVLHLMSGQHCLRTRCVAMVDSRKSRLSVAVASDLHFSTQWQELVAAVRHHVPALAHSIRDPLEYWQSFVTMANHQRQEGELDLVVLAGDLVDHVLASGPRDHQSSNVQHFLTALQSLRLPVVAIPGNHDFRLYPWRPRAYGLRALGLSPSQSRMALQRAGYWHGGRLRWGDLRSLQTRDEQHVTALADHLSFLAPATDFHIDLCGTRLILASTGADAILHPPPWRLSRLPAWLRSMSHIWRHPDSTGVDDAHARQLIARVEQAKASAIFLHAPFLHSGNGQPIDSSMPPMSAECSPQERQLESAWSTAGIRAGVCWQNSARVLGHLAAGTHPCTVFSGHVHRMTRTDLHRDTGRILSAEVGAPIDTMHTIPLWTTPALGQYGPGPEHRPGYLVATFTDGQLSSVHSCPLDP